MTPRYNVLYMLFLCFCWNENGNGLSRVKVIEKAKLLCTEHDICSQNNTTIGTIQDTSTCCTECSCEPNCKEYKNCCFPDQAYPIGNRDVEDKDGRRILENDTTLVFECLYPSSTQPNETEIEERIRQQSFWMISDIINIQTSPRNQTCGQRNIAPWGSLLPVSSKRSGHIYKNIFCAREHDVKEDDIVVWDGLNVCTKLRNFDIDETYLDRCQKRFYAPKGIAIRRSSLCFNALIDICPGKEEFDIPRNVDMSQSEVVHACISGLISPYRLTDMFANIFCHICNGKQIKGFRCSRLSLSLSNSEMRGYRHYLTGIINYNYLQSLSREQGLRGKKIMSRLACAKNDTVLGSAIVACRGVQCPIGKIRNSKGECLFGALQWHNVVFKTNIQLTSEKPFNVRLYFPDFASQRASDISNLESPFQKFLKIETVYYKPFMSLYDTNELLIAMATPSATNFIKQLMNEVTGIIDNKWLLRSHNTTLTLNAKLFRESFPHRVDMWNSSEGTSYHRIYRKRYGQALFTPFQLSKMHFCENILLQDHEFNISDNGIVINKVSNRYLYSAEYALEKSEQNTSCRVCLEASGFLVQEGANKSVGISLWLGLFDIVSLALFGILLMKPCKEFAV